MDWRGDDRGVAALSGGKSFAHDESLVEGYRPLVSSVCRRYLRRPEDVEDAAQETFLKLARHAGQIRAPLGSWLAATAHSTSIDLIRRSARERRRRREFSRIRSPDLPHHLLHQNISAKLAQAMRELDTSRRELITERFICRTPMRVLAGRHGVSVSAICRRTAAALGDLAAVLSDMGVESADALALAEHFGDSLDLAGHVGTEDPLRFAPDWRAGEDVTGDRACREPAFLPGWTRPIRVGVMISYRSTMVTGLDGCQWPADLQLHSTRWMSGNGLQLVSIVESDTAHRGSVERAMREHELIGGLIDVSDAEALETLDVILLGWNRSLSNDEARAIHRAVRSGVGLLNEYWTGGYDQMRASADVRALMLAASPVHSHHVATHGAGAPGHVVREHPVLPGLKPGMPIFARACGPLYKPADTATVVAVSDAVVCEEEHRITGLGRSPMPVCVAGPVGRGRVWVINAFPHHRLTPYLAGPFSAYLQDLLMWLAEPRRQ